MPEDSSDCIVAARSSLKSKETSGTHLIRILIYWMWRNIRITKMCYKLDVYITHTHTRASMNQRVSMNERVLLPCGTKRIVSPLVNGQNRDHTVGTQKSAFSCLISLAFLLRCKWTGIFLFFQGNEGEIAMRPHFMGATVATKLTCRKFSSAALESCLESY